MDKRYWSSLFVLGLILGCLFWSQKVFAKSYSSLYIPISDAKTALQEGRQNEAKALIISVEASFLKEEANNSSAGQEVKAILEELTKKEKLEQEDLVELSTKLLAFEEEQNPVDIEAEKAAFQNKVYAALTRLEEVLAGDDISAMKDEYLTYNSVWTRNESIVRTTSTAHYGKIETAMSFLRAALEMEPLDKTLVAQNLADLKAALDAFMTGQELSTKGQVTTLSEGIKLLETALSAFQKGQLAKAQESMKDFISNWPTFEGEVSTRSSRLYNQVESQVPILLVKGSETAYQDKLKLLIDDLKLIADSGNYTALDAMLILLREGVEALLIVLALIGTLKAAQQRKGLKWIYSGAVAGLLLSFLAAILLQMLFPTVTSGSNREMLEGFVGIFAVIMMVGVGIWLHSKSSSKAWQAYMDKQMALAMSTGGFVSMFGLSFLAVFREGAETILFYAGMLPRISSQDFFLGISLAILSLFILALVFVKWSDRLPIHRLFRVLTILIYLLAFKMLGSSIHHLQLTNVIPIQVLPQWPAIEWLGIYPTIEVLGSQLLFLLILAIIAYFQRSEVILDGKR